MSPQSRRPSHSPGEPGGGAEASRSAASPPNALFEELLRAARELLAVRSPLDAELMVSELLGTWWGQRGSGGGSAMGVERVLGDGLIAYSARKSSPAALALLSGIACLGTSRQASLAEQAALELMDKGVARPNWAQHLGAVTAAECYVNPDLFGDRDEIVCVFSYAGEELHALVTVVDYNADGMITDGWVTSRVDKLLEHCRQASGQAGAQPGTQPGTQGGRNAFRSIDPPQARHLLETALTVTDSAAEPPVSDSFPSYHAFIRARIRALPPVRVRVRDTAARRQVWSRERRALLAAEFLASDEAEDLSDPGAASHCADRIIDYGCDKDFGRPLRMSPIKVEKFLLGWLPRKVMLSAIEQDAMPHVLAAWVRWAGRRRGLAESAVGETLEAVFNAMGVFAQSYRDPAEFGLDAALVARLLPDGDLEALPRRAFAFPLLEGWHGGIDLSTLDPSDPADRRALLAADHDSGPGRRGASRHIERHLELAERLWRGDPPELWEAAQRLLDSGRDRHLVLHALMDALDAAGDGDGDIVAALRDLAADEP